MQITRPSAELQVRPLVVGGWRLQRATRQNQVKPLSVQEGKGAGCTLFSLLPASLS